MQGLNPLISMFTENRKIYSFFDRVVREITSLVRVGKECSLISCPLILGRLTCPYLATFTDKEHFLTYF